MLKWACITFGAALLITVAILLACNAIVVHYAKGRIYDNVRDIPSSDAALLLGTSPISRLTGQTNYFYEFRLNAAAELYRAGKIKRILISGDSNSHLGLDETHCMQRDLALRGVPADACLLDGEGYRTEASIRNAYTRYGLRSFTIISQHFHNERALYLAGHAGLDFEQVQAFDAAAPDHPLSYITYAREYLARVKMFILLLTT